MFVAGFGPIVRDLVGTREFYSETLGLVFEEDDYGYMYTGELDGVKHFALGPLEQAAQSCFGLDHWPGDVPMPQGGIEFDVKDIATAIAGWSRKATSCWWPSELNLGVRS